MHSQEFIQRMKEKLLEEKESLTAELNDLQMHTEMGDEEDENAQEINTDEVNQDIAAQLKSDLEKIDLALKKIEDGKYGMTDDGQMIPESRLEIIPWADTIVEE